MTGDEELFDPELQRRLRAVAPTTHDTPAVLDALRPRMVRARRRRQGTMAIGVAASALLVGGTVMALRGGDDPSSLDVVSGPTPSITSVVTTLATTTSVLTTAPVPTTTVVVPTPTEAPPPPTTAAAPASTRAPVATAPAAPSTVPPTSAAQTRTFSSSGGTLTVRFDGRTMSAPVATPAPGWTAKVDTDSADEVEVEFRRGEDEVKIRVRVVAGQLVRDDD